MALGTYNILQGNSLDLLRAMPDESVQCCVTSPPYWGLRKYAGEQDFIWNDDPLCEHDWQSEAVAPQSGGTGPASSKQVTNKGTQGEVQEPVKRSFCSQCSAWRGALGLEPTPELYIQHLVELFREVSRVLKDDGTLWLNLGDSYVGATSQHKDGGSQGETSCIAKKTMSGIPNTGRKERNKGMMKAGLKMKDLVGIPWMAAFALRDDGWYLRSDIIWSKTNAMPESVRDRPTKSHEYIFLLSKSQKYYYDKDAVLEPCSTKSTFGKPRPEKPTPSGEGDNVNNGATKKSLGHGSVGNSEGRNCRSVWHIPTKPYKGAHFAVFPPDLVKPCILAGCPEGGLVLDPFSGSGTTLAVAISYGRNGLGLEASSEYIELAHERISAVVPGLKSLAAKIK